MGQVGCAALSDAVKGVGPERIGVSTIKGVHWSTCARWPTRGASNEGAFVVSDTGVRARKRAYTGGKGGMHWVRLYPSCEKLLDDAILHDCGAGVCVVLWDGRTRKKHTQEASHADTHTQLHRFAG